MTTGLLQDFRYAFRQIRKTPGFAAIAVITLALGIGANTAVFSVIDAVILRPLPYHEPERLIEAQSVNTHHPQPSAICYPDFFDWRSQNRTLENLVSYHESSYTLTGLERPIALDADVVSWDFLPALGIQPELGRGFTADEEKVGTRVVLISHTLWATQFNSDKSIVGRTIHLSGDVFTVIGVMPASFRFPVNKPSIAAWTTLAVDNDPTDPHPATSNRGSHFLSAFGRMKPGVTLAQADQDLKSIAAALAKQYPNTNTRHDSARTLTVVNALLGDTRGVLLLVLGAVALVLLIACGNIANLLLARMRERQREIALRSALGAGRKRLVRQLLAESLTLSALGGLAGCGLAFFCTPAILSLIGDSVPRAQNAGVDLRVLGFATALSFAAGIVFGILPAISSVKPDLVSTLKEGGRTDIIGRDWLRSSLTVGQVALGLVLTMAAGLLIKSFANLMHVQQGFNPNGLTTLFFETPDTRYSNSRPQFYREYFEKLRALPGVESANGALILPMSDEGVNVTFSDPEHPVPESQEPAAYVTTVTPGYFHTMQVSLLSGRDFTDRDDMKSQQVMIVNEAFAKKFFPRESVIGKKLKPGAGNGSPGGPPWREVVGVVGDTRFWATQRESEPAMFLPADQLPTWCCLYSVVRTSVDPLSLAASVRQIVSSLDKEIPVTRVRTMDELMSTQLSQPRFSVVLMSTFAGLAIVLTLVGLYGVMTYSVTRRTREIGVRMALGAQRAAVLKMVLREAAILLACGLVIGIAGALASGSLLQSMLFGTGSRNPAVLVEVCAAIALAGLAAAYIPAFRAAKVDPMEALRYE
ncbi:MAG TPA: ABC transporter permease [Candidatus Solibacter sp.]|nr:ABC transporter permease [Candidatus Solibacter sp.]